MEIIPLTPKHHDGVLEHLKQTFFADEPLNHATKLCKRGEGHSELEKVVFDTLEDNMSLVAIQPDGQISGVALNGWLGKEDVAQGREKLKECKEIRFKTVFTLLYDENIKVDLFSQFNLDKIFEVRILSVDSRLRGQGIAKKLFQESENFARSIGAKVIKADCTGLFSQKITASLGYVVVHERYYKDYVDENGERIIPVEPPHEKFQIKYKVVT